MPIIEVTIAEGRSDEELRKLISELTHAAHRAIGTPVANVRVILRETPKTHFAAGDVTLAEREVSAAKIRISGTTADVGG
ncbi:4-oxalocrotonate tautomerase [Rhodococcus wratislaviensis]|uniref:4-oxalocrotonate tautomerase n=1 Tax=Rhodococcus wratislaviensis TaxID=44752 RepID=A0A402C1A5_RHOWR|nr:tautomerase family protein [Rhodococcus wratislaviensis]GCE37384.1 4-oxalocrotonate tautomerase [Rhodococcus wratislaviensis]